MSPKSQIALSLGIQRLQYLSHLPIPVLFNLNESCYLCVTHSPHLWRLGKLNVAYTYKCLFKGRGLLQFSACAVILVNTCSSPLGRLCVFLASAPFMNVRCISGSLDFGAFCTFKSNHSSVSFEDMYPRLEWNRLSPDCVTLAHTGNRVRRRLHFQILLRPLLRIQGN